MVSAQSTIRVEGEETFLHSQTCNLSGTTRGGQDTHLEGALRACLGLGHAWDNPGLIVCLFFRAYGKLRTSLRLS